MVLLHYCSSENIKFCSVLLNIYKSLTTCPSSFIPMEIGRQPQHVNAQSWAVGLTCIFENSWNWLCSPYDVNSFCMAVVCLHAFISRVPSNRPLIFYINKAWMHFFFFLELCHVTRQHTVKPFRTLSAKCRRDTGMVMLSDYFWL